MGAKHRAHVLSAHVARHEQDGEGNVDAHAAAPHRHGDLDVR